VYLLEDQLGGVDGFTSASGALLSRTSYQPFGARRSGDWLTGAPTSSEWQQIKATTPRGYTDHEHLDNLGIVHMNGRVYDPVLGRFLSPDPIVQSPYDTQGLNRYAYVRNNPMRYTDPTGFCFNGHPAADQQAEECMENIIVSSTGLTEWQISQLIQLVERTSLMSTLLGAGRHGGAEHPEVPPAGHAATTAPPVDAGPVEQAITVTATPLISPIAPKPLLPALRNLPLTGLTSRLLFNFGLAGALASALAAPSEISDTSDLLDESGNPTHIYHFTNDFGKRGISASGVLMPGGSGLVYFSPLPYSSAAQAQSALALPRTPTGYFMIPRSNVPGPLNWTVVQPSFGQPGGGIEGSFPGSVPLNGAQWVSFGR
jgi:RHS repeat-associated protein